MAKFPVLRYLILICLVVTIGIVQGANNGRFPVAYRGTKGWIGLEQGNDESSLTFDFSSLNTTASEIDWSILDTPFIYGDETCDELVRRRRFRGSIANGTLKVTNRLGGGGWRGGTSVKIPLSSLQARSILVTEGGSKDPKALVCANILSDDILVFESRFYGPQIVGDIYFFLDMTTKTLKLFSRLTNGNSLEPTVNWTLKNKWWRPNADSGEPGWQSCRESGDKIDSRYDPPANLASLQPETVQLLEIKDWKNDSASGQSSAKDDLEASVLVVKGQPKSWDRYNVFGCSRIRLSDGWGGQAKAKGENGLGTEQFVSFKQDSLFHPLLVRFKLPQQQITVSKPALGQVHKDANNGSLSSSVFISSNSTRKNVNTLAPPSFSLHKRSLSSNNDADCQRLGQRLNFLSPDNSLQVESDQADDDSLVYSAFFTDAALESTVNNVLMKTIRVQWPNKDSSDLCATIRPSQERTIFAQSSFYYPFAGAVGFAQPKNRPEAATVVAGDLHHLFDDAPSSSGNWSIMVRSVDPTLDDMSCALDRDAFDPTTMGTELCRKSKATCSIGDLTAHLGPIYIAGFDQPDATASAAAFSYASRTVPLGGPFSVLGQTLKVDVGWVKGCANISYTPSLALVSEEQCASHGSVTGILHRGAMATFERNGVINGTVFMYQPIGTENDALPSSPTTICNQLQLSNGTKMSNLLFEVIDAPKHNGTVDAQSACRNASALAYNPFFVNVANKSYSTLCSKNSAECALGDLTQRIQSVPPQQCSCVTFMPVSGPFGINGRVLRIRRADSKQLVACTAVTSWDVGSTEVYVQDGANRQQMADSISDEFHLDSQQVEVTASKDESAISKFKGCVLYDVFIFDPASSSVIETLSKYIENKQSPWSKKWGSDKCVSGGSISRVSVISVLQCILSVLVVTKLRFQI